MFGQYWLRVHVILHVWQESIILEFFLTQEYESVQVLCSHLGKYGGLYALFNIITRFLRVGYMDDYDESIMLGKKNTCKHVFLALSGNWFACKLVTFLLFTF